MLNLAFPSRRHQSPYYQTFSGPAKPGGTGSPDSHLMLLSTPLKQKEAQKLILKDFPFMLSATSGAMKEKAAGQGRERAAKYSEEQVAPLVKREVESLARQRIKIRDPTDFLKVQQRVKNDLDSMNHTNAFFRQRYSAYVNGHSIADSQNPETSQERLKSSQGCYRPRPFVDSRSNCLANYDEYLIMRQMDQDNKKTLRSYLMHQIQQKHQQNDKKARRNAGGSLQQSGVPLPVKSTDSLSESYQNDNSPEKIKERNIVQEKKRDQQILSQRLREQIVANRLLEKLQPRNDKKKAQESIDREQMKDYQNFLQVNLKKQRLQKEMGSAYRNNLIAGNRRNLHTSTQRTIEPYSQDLLSRSPKTMQTPIQKDEDFALDHGILSHFFRKELDVNEGNPGRAYMNKAVKKQKDFEKVFLKHVLDGERLKQSRIDRRSQSVVPGPRK